MLPPKSIREIPPAKVRRQEENTDAGFAEECYDDCNQAALEGLSTGKIPELCAENSTFLTLYQQCSECIALNINNNDNSTSGSSDSGAADIIPELGQFYDFCEGQGDSTSNVTNIDDLLASWSSLAQTRSAIEETLASLGHNVTTTDAGTGAEETGGGTGSSTAVSTATATGNAGGSSDVSASSDSGSADVNVIVPAVVVPVVCVLGLMILAWAIMRRRKRRRELEASKRDEADKSYEEKAQLHADEFRPELNGVSAVEIATSGSQKGNEGSGFVAELPAREVVGSELDARERGST